MPTFTDAQTAGVNPAARKRRPGRVQTAWLMFLGSFLLLVALAGLLAWDSLAGWFVPRPRTRPLVVFCAAGLKAPVEAVAREYQEKFGALVQLQYGGSNTLLAALQVSDKGDVYIPADESYVQTARDRDLIAEVLPLATQQPVLAVRKGNPKNIRSLDDLCRRGLRIAQANPEAAAVGKLAREGLMRANKWQAFAERIVVTKPTVNDVAADIQVGAVDAGVVWDATVRQLHDELEVIAEPAFINVQALLSACITRHTTQPTAALRFARYLAARDAGLPTFAKNGYVPVEGDRWEETPELRLFAGAMLRPAIDRTITAFEEREGARVMRIYNGCGILVAQMKTGHNNPDAFFACDKEFMDQVHDLFGAPTTLSSNQLVILVHKGNPHGIKRLRDLAKPGVRVGVGHEKQCAMGVVTQETLRQDRSQEAVMKNVKVQSPTGDMLVNQMLTGSLDVAIAYISNAAGHKDRLEAIAIDIPCAIVDQPFAVGKDSGFKYLTARLLDALRRAESRAQFEAYGFTWKADARAGKAGAKR